MLPSENLRIAAIFIILATSALGVVSPIVWRDKEFMKTGGIIFCVFKSFAGGVILGTGFIHMFPEASENLAEAFEGEEYPYAALIAVFSVFGTLMIEQLAKIYYTAKMQSTSQIAGDAQTDKTREARQLEGEKGAIKAEAPGNKPLNDVVAHVNADIENILRDGQVRGPKDAGHVQPAVNKAHILELGTMQNVSPDGKAEERGEGHHHHEHEHDHHHDHDHDHDGHAHVNFLDLYSKNTTDQARSFVIAHVLELGIAMHSVLIGIALGVEEGYSSVTALLVALSLHQFFEGFALGQSIAHARIVSTLHVVILVLIFTLTTPIGIVIGFNIQQKQKHDTDGEHGENPMVNGVLDSISAGILTYMALVDLIAEDFTQQKVPKNQIMMLIAVGLGISVMAILAMWA